MVRSEHPASHPRAELLPGAGSCRSSARCSPCRESARIFHSHEIFAGLQVHWVTGTEACVHACCLTDPGAPRWVWGCRRCPVWGLQVHTGDAQPDLGCRMCPARGVGAGGTPSHCSTLPAAAACTAASRCPWCEALPCPVPAPSPSLLQPRLEAAASGCRGVARRL